MVTSLIPAPGVGGQGVGRYDGHFFNPSTRCGGGGQRQADLCELNVSLLYMMSSRPARAI